MRKADYTSEDLISHHGVAAVIKDMNGNILMQKHVKYGFWTIPVGKVKEGQEIDDGLREEVKEECGIVIKEFEEIRSKKYTYTRRGNKVVVLGHVFEIMKYKGRVKNNEPQKHSEQLFLPVSKIRKLPYVSDLTLLYLYHIGIKRKPRYP